MPRYTALLDEEDGKVGAFVPDCPGCTAMGDNEDDAVNNITDALKEWMADRIAAGIEPPRARSMGEIRIAEILSGEAPRYSQMVLIPVLLDSGRLVRANISLDAGLLEQIDVEAKRRGLTRSAFLASAAREKIEAEG